MLRQHYDTDALDASALLAAMFGFLPGDDPATAGHRVGDRRRTDRRRLCAALPHQRDRRRAPQAKRARFSSARSGWFQRWSIIGQNSGRAHLMERLIRVASPLGLYAEEYDVETGRHLGNFPQAFSHLALVEAAGRIIVAQRIQEVRG